ncbi:MerR family transcriptional regulator [Streptomyces sp. NPDC048496]|uniref:MerR family transcriptional regulator n=1 Tax=Streptomyces sp. NPDC048496 TaxID=3365558 RepID=UPI00371A8A17
MRIGEIAGLVGVTSRAIRHYHHIGLLPEPGRRANGYRVYTVRDAVLLARIRRLTELGLGLDEVRDVLADDAGRELADVLGELDADLARQESEIRERRRLLARLLDGPSTAEEPVSPALAELLGALPATGSPTAAKDREHLALLDTVGGGSEVFDALRPLAEDPAVLALYERLDALAAAPVAVPDDPDGVLDLVVGSQTTVTVELTRPVEFVRPLGKREWARTVRFHADDPRAAVAALTRGRTVPSPPPGPPG